MRPFSSRRASAALILVAGLLAGCTTMGEGVYRPSERVVVRGPAPAAVSPAVYHRANRDATTYARSVNRAVRMTPRQQQVVREKLARRTHVLLERTHPRDHRYIYPFPRRAGERDRLVQRFWRDVDRDIERTLNRSQRRVYRDYVRYHFSGRSSQRPGHPLGGPPGRRR